MKITVKIYSFEELSKESQRLVCRDLKKLWGSGYSQQKILQRIESKNIYFNKYGEIISNLPDFESTRDSKYVEIRDDRKYLRSYQILNSQGLYSNGYINNQKGSFKSEDYSKKWYSLDGVKKFIRNENLDDTYRIVITRYIKTKTEYKKPSDI